MEVVQPIHALIVVSEEPGRRGSRDAGAGVFLGADVLVTLIKNVGQVATMSSVSSTAEETEEEISSITCGHSTDGACGGGVWVYLQVSSSNRCQVAHSIADIGTSALPVLLEVRARFRLEL